MSRWNEMSEQASSDDDYRSSVAQYTKQEAATKKFIADKKQDYETTK